MPSNTPLVGVDAARIPIKVSAVARQRTSPEEEDPVQEHGDGSPPSGPCDAGELRCVHRSAWVCEAGVWRLGSCPGQAVCWDGVCREPWCTPGTSWCTRSDALAVCNPHGVSVESYACPEGTVCEGGSCEPLCEPGRTRCVGDEVQECQPDGRTFAVVDSCDPEQGRTCIDGACQGGCAAYRAKGQSIGCEFWGVDAPNRFGLHNRFAFVVGNVDPEAMAHVKVESSDGQLLAESAVAPGQMAALHLPHPRMTNVSESGVTDFGLRIVSDAPINAYQFNPLERYDDDNAQLAVASTDASLLLNGSGLGTEHLVLSYPQWSHYGSFVTIVSAEDHNLVTVRPTADTASGLNVPALVAGATWNVTLERGQVLTLLTNREGSDLTGTEVLSSAPVAVYGGVDCARIPIESDFCDHIEEVSLPVSVWGRVYVGARFGQRGLARDVWRVVSSRDGAVVVTDPPLWREGEVVLDRGESYTFEAEEDFVLEASEAVALVHYMTGSSTTGLTSHGDPSMQVIAPVRQHRRITSFLVPDTYTHDAVAVAMPIGAQVMLNGQPLESYEGVERHEVGASSFQVVRLPVRDGHHRLTSDHPVGVAVYGLDHNISYAYPAGMNLHGPWFP